jgi:hypothetical protein
MANRLYSGPEKGTSYHFIPGLKANREAVKGLSEGLKRNFIDNPVGESYIIKVRK